MRKKSIKKEKTQKSHFFLCFLLIFQNHPGILEKHKKRNYPGISIFSTFFSFFPDFFLSTYRGDFAKKTKKKFKKMTLFSSYRGRVLKNKISGICGKFDIPSRKGQKTVKDNTDFFFLLFAKTPYILV